VFPNFHKALIDIVGMEAITPPVETDMAYSVVARFKNEDKQKRWVRHVLRALLPAPKETPGVLTMDISRVYMLAGDQVVYAWRVILKIDHKDAAEDIDEHLYGVVRGSIMRLTEPAGVRDGDTVKFEVAIAGAGRYRAGPGGYPNGMGVDGGRGGAVPAGGDAR